MIGKKLDTIIAKGLSRRENTIAFIDINEKKRIKKDSLS